MPDGLLDDALTGQSGIDGDLLFIASEDGWTFANSGRTVSPRDQPREHTALYRSTLVPDTQEDVPGYLWAVFRTFITAPEPG